MRHDICTDTFIGQGNAFTIKLNFYMKKYIATDQVRPFTMKSN